MCLGIFCVFEYKLSLKRRILIYIILSNDTLRVVVEDVCDYKHGVRVESELRQEFQVPVRQWDARR